MQLIPLCFQKDFELIAKYTRALFGELFGAEAIPSDSTLERIRASHDSTETKHWAFLVKHEDQDVGYFTLAESFSIFAHGHYGILNELWVAPEHRSNGIGEYIISQIRQFAQQRDWLRLDVTAPPMEKWQRSVNFYEGQGFIHTGKKLKLIMED